MKTKTSIFFLLILPVLVRCRASAEDAWKSYIGKNDCITELSSPVNRYGVRLDRAQKAYLVVYKFKDLEIVTIVQYEKDFGRDRKHCGVIRDVTRVQDKDSSVVWECSDGRRPADVVIATWPANHSESFGAATEAWRIDLEQLKFIPVEQASKSVYCRPNDRKGNDDGEGLSDWTKKQALKHP